MICQRYGLLLVPHILQTLLMAFFMLFLLRRPLISCAFMLAIASRDLLMTNAVQEASSDVSKVVHLADDLSRVLDGLIVL